MSQLRSPLICYLLISCRLEIFDEYTRRQYMAKAPTRNPFGEDEEPAKFNEMDIYTRIQVLQQLSTWTFGNAERVRGMMPQDEDHLNWRMDPLGWDKDDRAYFVLDDNRLYRRSDEPPPPPTLTQTPKLKSKSKSSRKSRSKPTRSSKRRKIEDTEDDEPEEMVADPEPDAQEDTVMTNCEDALPEENEQGYGFTRKTWECVAITLNEYHDFLATIFRSRDPNEKQLRKRIEEDVVPIIEKRAEAIRQKQLRKFRDLENREKLATAKRSSRLAGKAEKEREEREKQEAQEKRERDLRMAHEEEERQRRIEEVSTVLKQRLYYYEADYMFRATSLADSPVSNASKSAKSSAYCTKKSCKTCKKPKSAPSHRTPAAKQARIASASLLGCRKRRRNYTSSSSSNSKKKKIMAGGTLTARCAA